MFFIFFIGLFSLTLDPTKELRAVLSLSVASLTALLYYELVIERITPSVDYFTISDQIYTLLLCIGSSIFCLHLFLIHYYAKWIAKTGLKEVLQYIQVSMAIFRGGLFLTMLAVMFVSLAILLP